ncbi:MAG: nitrate/nitrite transporter NrtS [Marinobacter sp.]|nr:nitrate/nitrite transporter NrtS [Marinobacter sp.]
MSFIQILRTPARGCREACELAVGPGTPRRSAKLAVVVGTLLVLINQWEAVTGAASMDWLKVVLTFCVPYLVSTYTSVSKDLTLLREAEAAEQAVHEEARTIQMQSDSV